MNSDFDPNLKYCVIDENIWIHALNLCDRFDKYCLDSLRLFKLYSACPYKIKMIVNTNYQQIIISKLKNIQNECKDSDSQIRFNFLYPLITKDYQRLEYYTNFDIHHPNRTNYDNFYRDFECQIKYDDYYLMIFYLLKEQECIIITNDDDVLKECKNIGFRAIDAKGAISEYQC